MKIAWRVLVLLCCLNSCGFSFDPSEHCFSDQNCAILYATAGDSSAQPDSSDHHDTPTADPGEPPIETHSPPDTNLANVPEVTGEEVTVSEDWWSAADSPDSTAPPDANTTTDDTATDTAGSGSPVDDAASQDTSDNPEVNESPDTTIALCDDATDCSDNNPCTVDVCVPKFGCVSQAGLLTGLNCNDNSACTTNDVCTDDGTCVGTVVICAAVDQCHQPGACDPATGLCSHPPSPNGSECEDGLVCTIMDNCQEGLCHGGTPLCQPDTCHKSVICHEDTGTCVHPIGSELCTEDGDVCTHDFCDLKIGCYGINVGIKPDNLGGCGVSGAAVGDDPDHDGLSDQYDEDDDGDGIPDYGDNAPRIWNPDQVDTDGDGLGDVKDADANGDGVCDPTWPTAPYGYCGTPPPP